MFSQRYQYSHKRETLQRESMDVPMRTALWNLFVGIYFKKSSRLAYYPWMLQFSQVLYTEFLARPVVDIPVYSSKVRDDLHSFFLNEEWFRIYDLFEFVAAIDSQSRGKRFAWHNPLRQTFVHYTNVLLERHSAAYRFVGYKVQEITDPEELKILQEALATDDDFVRVRLQLRSAFESLTSDSGRNYRTSIVETLRGLDLLSEIVLEKKGLQLGGLIDMLPLDSRLILSLKTLFNHRQESDVVYHPLLEKQDLSFHDTKFFLVMAIGLCNYISSFDKSTLADNALRSQQSMQERTVIASERTHSPSRLETSSLSSRSKPPSLETPSSETTSLETPSLETTSSRSDRSPSEREQIFEREQKPSRFSFRKEEKKEPLVSPSPRPPLPPLPSSEDVVTSLTQEKYDKTSRSESYAEKYTDTKSEIPVETKEREHFLAPDPSGTSPPRKEEERPGRWLFSQEKREKNDEEPSHGTSQLAENKGNERDDSDDSAENTDMPKRWLNSIFGDGRKNKEGNEEKKMDTARKAVEEDSSEKKDKEEKSQEAEEGQKEK